MLDGILKSLLGLLLEAHARVKEEIERQSFPNAEERSLPFISALYLSVPLTLLAVGSPRAGAVSLISESPALAQ